MTDDLAGYPPLLATLLRKRGITNTAEAEVFLNPSYERDIGDPFGILNMERAVERIFSAMERNESIVVYGDYDCDGIPGSVVLHDMLKKFEYPHFKNYIPHRHEEGYGLNLNAVEKFADEGVKLIITVDCGIADVVSVTRAQELGVDVIVTDHHLPQEVLPPAYTILNSKQEGDTYPDNMLCGAGVAWKLSQALIARAPAELRAKIPEGFEKWLLDMAGLSTIADMVPLKKENRALAYFGLKVLRKSKRPGLKILLQKAGVSQAYLAEDDVGFMIAPRINAASRMSTPFEAFELLSTTDPARAEHLANHLNSLNDTRKGIVATMIKEARHNLEMRELRKVIVVGNPLWRPGVLGLAANKLMEDYGRPAFVWGRAESEHIKGSCRSDGSINVVKLMTSVREGFFLNVGGHEYSGGFSVSHENVHFLEDAILEAYERLEKKTADDRAIIADAELTIDDVAWKTWDVVEKLAPFGVENPKPIFVLKGIEVFEVRMFGKEKNHLELSFRNGRGQKVSAIGFFATDESFKVKPVAGARIDLYATLEKSMFRGRPELRLRIMDVM
ncbi:MAG: single-stranded-DNA-specific exonuclease RecJ [Candidatus Yonathbacteria bacterium RIFOXYC1_FULL_52_10]|uniref:Single-stranded-DNA-specific exonuclease RecJ n=1 Tax=Candidatus Yonathbacteria bacterium RIFOXYD1_FULL_52_36 TaxID=1802730 RepID=A0A1G2SIQ5_9BACT|nr:MAG: single-stranded-DNA-specific exonuclease RecJ [Candidatus Yonathbacteria bacterium RIFOXYD1_FULL_52_36]OHA85549.1 MAG: single-stranded-DNA-specific exonuclease RecJ [Candidatus Yonathbacteria bacterium RIFOXYC1_FULL_52_10]